MLPNIYSVDISNSSIVATATILSAIVIFGTFDLLLRLRRVRQHEKEEDAQLNTLLSNDEKGSYGTENDIVGPVTRGRAKRALGQKKSHQKPVLQVRKEVEMKMKGTKTGDEDMEAESVDFQNLLHSLGSSGEAN